MHQPVFTSHLPGSFSRPIGQFNNRNGILSPQDMLSPTASTKSGEQARNLLLKNLDSTLFSQRELREMRLWEHQNKLMQSQNNNTEIAAQFARTSATSAQSQGYGKNRTTMHSGCATTTIGRNEEIYSCGEQEIYHDQITQEQNQLTSTQGTSHHTFFSPKNQKSSQYFMTSPKATYLTNGGLSKNHLLQKHSGAIKPQFQTIEPGRHTQMLSKRHNRQKLQNQGDDANKHAPYMPRTRSLERKRSSKPSVGSNSPDNRDVQTIINQQEQVQYMTCDSGFGRIAPSNLQTEIKSTQHTPSKTRPHLQGTQSTKNQDVNLGSCNARLESAGFRSRKLRVTSGGLRYVSKPQNNQHKLKQNQILNSLGTVDKHIFTGGTISPGLFSPLAKSLESTRRSYLMNERRYQKLNRISGQFTIGVGGGTIAEGNDLNKIVYRNKQIGGSKKRNQNSAEKPTEQIISIDADHQRIENLNKKSIQINFESQAELSIIPKALESGDSVETMPHSSQIQNNNQQPNSNNDNINLNSQYQSSPFADPLQCQESQQQNQFQTITKPIQPAKYLWVRQISQNFNLDFQILNLLKIKP